MTAGQHNASASAVGYLYQVNWALIELLESAPTKPDQAISLETHDWGCPALTDRAGNSVRLPF
jgi:hypothetical protein